MRRSADITAVVRTGRRTRRGSVVVHHLPELRPAPAAPLVGFVVSRSVGGSVVRHRTVRRLRAVVARRLAALPAGSGTVVRALPEAADATSSRLDADLDAALSRVTGAVRR